MGGMGDPFGGAFNGRTVSALKMLPQDPRSGSPVVVAVEFDDGSVLSFVTDKPISGKLTTAVGVRDMTYAPGVFAGGDLRRQQ